MKKILITILGLALSYAMFGQGVVNGFHCGKGHLNIAPFYSFENYTQFYRGTEKVDLPPFLEEMTVMSTGLYADYGILKNLDVSLNVPFVFVSTSDDAVDAPDSNGGIQDLAINVKYSPLMKKNYNLGVIVGLSAPLSNYEVSVPTGIGSGSTHFSTGLFGQYKLNNGLFFSGQFSHTYKREIVPNSLNSSLKVGFAHSKIYADLWFAHQSSTSGSDIGDEGFAFQGTRVNYSKLGGVVVKPITSIIQVAAGGSYILGGRNAGKAWGINAALIFKLDFSKEE